MGALEKWPPPHFKTSLCYHGNSTASAWGGFGLSFSHISRIKMLYSKWHIVKTSKGVLLVCRKSWELFRRHSTFHFCRLPILKYKNAAGENKMLKEYKETNPKTSKAEKKKDKKCEF